MRMVKGAAALGCAILALPAGAQGSTADVEALGAAHAAEHAALERAAESGPQRPRPYSRARQRALAAQAGAPEEVGRWDTGPFPIPNFAIHSVLLPTGKVLTWGYPPKLLLEVRPNFGQASVWDPATGEAKDVPPPPVDGSGEPASIYCSGQTFLPDGTVLLTGGNKRFPGAGQNYAGLDSVFTFDPWNERWTEQPDMRHGRWYPSQVELADGRTLIVGGYDESEPGGRDTRDVEIFHAPATSGGQGSVELKESASRQTALYPHLFLMPDGDVLLGGPGEGDSAILDTSSFSWRDLPHAGSDRIGGTAVLELSGDGGDARVTQIGGYDYISDQADSPAHASTETLTYSSADSGWSPGPALNIGRSYANTVLLPDGSMATVGGGKGKYPRQDDNFTVYEDGRARQVELWDPDSRRWTLGPPQQEDRGYHSTALLLPDGRVFSAGDDMHPTEDSDTGEIYSPPYLFQGERPEITLAPAALPWGKQFAIRSGSGVTGAVLMSPGATTHGADMHQRRIELRISKTVPGQGVNAVSPATAEIAPPGWYMLFVLDGKGVPSHARWLRVGADAPAPPYFDTEPPRPRLSLVRTSLSRLARGKPLAIKLSVAEGVTGRLNVRLRVRPRRGRSFMTPLGFLDGQLLADGEGSRRLRFKLSRSQRKQMRRARSVDVLAKAKVRDQASNRGSARLTRTVR